MPADARKGAGRAAAIDEVIREARSDRPFHARDQYVQPVPTDMAMIRRRDYHLENEIPAAFRGTRSALWRDLRGGRQIRLDAGSSGLGQPQPLRHRHRRRVRTDQPHDPRRGRQQGPDRRRAAASARRDGQRQPRGRRGRVPGAAAPPPRPRGAGRRHARSARQCDAADGRQCERADRLSAPTRISTSTSGPGRAPNCSSGRCRARSGRRP